jgi:serine protease Do
MTVKAISPELKTQFNLGDDAKGVVITEVAGDSPAAQENIRPGDLIVEVGQEEVGSPPEILAKVNQAKQDGKKSILLLVDRQGDLRFVALRFKE